MSSESGQCLCGAVRVQAEVTERHHGACHCGMCRRWGSGPFLATSVGGVEFTGDEHIRRYRSSDWAERGFCDICGANLFYHLIEPDVYVMSIGVFDSASEFDLTEEIYIDSKPDGYAFAGEHPRLTEAETIAKYVQSDD